MIRFVAWKKKKKFTNGKEEGGVQQVAATGRQHGDQRAEGS